MADSTTVFNISSATTSTEGVRVRVFSSDPIASVDAPEVYEVVGKFIYNHFVPNERNEYSGASGFTSSPFTSSTANDFNGKKPRYTEISFLQPQSDYAASTSSEVRSYLNNNALLGLVEQGFVHVEDSVTSSKFQRIQITTAGLNVQTVNLLSGSSSYLTEDQADSRSSNPELSQRVAQSIAGVRGFLPSDLSTSISSVSSDEEISGAIIKYINASGQPLQGIGYYSSETREKIESRLDILTDRQETLGINRIVLDSVVRASACNINHLMNGEVAEYLTTSAQIQSEARTTAASLGINYAGYDISVTPFSTVEGTTTSYRSVHVGYIIEKLEINQGEIVEHPTIVIEGANTTTIRDTYVNYGALYKYRVRAVFMREMPAILESSGTLGTVRFLVASSGEDGEAFVPCVEEVPPPEPADLLLTYDYEREAVRVTWALPVNPQIDIKYFQVFRRSSLSSPFKLIRVIDFDNSGTKEKPRETYPHRIVDTVDVAQCFYLDKVPSDREFVYAVCSVDAHGLSSGYSLQMGCMFRTSRNELMTKVISRSGAPKTYPNLYINEDAFSDAVNVGGSRRLTTFLDAELLTVTLPNGSSENIVEDATFTISLINEDNCLTDKVVLTTSKYQTTTLYASGSITGTPEEVLLAPDDSSGHVVLDYDSGALSPLR